MMNSKGIKKKTCRPELKPGLPDLDHAKSAVLNGLRSPESQRGYPNSFLRSSVSHGGGKMGQIQFLLGHVSVETIEVYLRGKWRVHDTVNDRLGVKP